MNKRNKVCLIGAGGRMGKAITEVLFHSKTSVLGSAVEKTDSILLGMDSGLNSGLGENHVRYSSDIDRSLEECDVAIDFSFHAILPDVLSACEKHKKPVVIGATGHTEKEIELMHQVSTKIPILCAPNMSVGVNLMFKLVELAAKTIGDEFDIEVTDIHHRHKKDAPSGTAVALKQVLLKTLDRLENDVIYGRHGNYGERDKKQIGIHTLRAGEVIGEHTVEFFSAEERISVHHRAESRKTFAVGAVKASEFIVQQKFGMFNMFDVLGI
ncbi:MAG TPA: 4-hydroxy-tetrahydrodipicolinate reductase [Leptospiraceae bacterium]|nr:4-hydroxy-tetrahydrodipicolinate reductase [Leptospiraceae bacterium]HMZ60302.1 4-hydroxy-tetrahydrodipicolinate reductase [Leptospiraceae bacterium]HNF27018.1 4-hydroxy-tetrahydrodipicolinate reductase [Leptospiraceae bacterium]HNM04724.1 4-hydroxy-tetrahydrodipicolinate reductase [Leptospiraceae bacterium]HNN06974.1 4-hydroxy-tetrahydrodipicolinate reductase [Leptospiraceae bacterium]